MRQQDDQTFTAILNRIRTGKHTKDDIQVLRSRIITENTSAYPNDALHVYRTNASVNAKNLSMLNELAPPECQHVITSQDCISGQTSVMRNTNISTQITETGGLETILKVANGAHVMLTVNVDVSDGLVNGA